MGYLKEILAVCSTALAIYGMWSGQNGNLITGVVGFWGVLIGSEVTKSAASSQEKD
jgi:hypothetical protein